MPAREIDLAVERQPFENENQALVGLARRHGVGPRLPHGTRDLQMKDVAVVDRAGVPRRGVFIASNRGDDTEILEARFFLGLTEHGTLRILAGVHRSRGNLQSHEGKVAVAVDQQVHLSLDGGGNVGEDFLLQSRARVHQLSRKPNLTRRMAILLDLETKGLEQKLPRLLRERLARELDPQDLDLVRVEPHARFDVRAPAKEDGSRDVLFRVEQRQEVPEGRSWTVVTKDPALRSNLTEAVRWWANETIWVSDRDETLPLPPAQFPNARTYSTREGLIVKDVSHYRLKCLTHVLDEHDAALAFLPFEFEIFPPNEDDARRAADKWREGMQKAFDEFRVVEMKTDPGKPFALLRSQYYRAHLMPQLAVLGRYATEAETEKAAEDFRGPCFVANLATGSFASRWADR